MQRPLLNEAAMVSSLHKLVHSETSSPVVLDGQSLDVSAVVAVARYTYSCLCRDHLDTHSSS